MRIITTNYTKRPQRAFLSFCMAFLLLASLLFGFLPQRALAMVQITTNYPSTPYLENILYYEAPDHASTTHVIFSFHVKQTFAINYSQDMCIYNPGTGKCDSTFKAFPSQTFTAGQDYSATFDQPATAISFGGGYIGKFGGIDYWMYFQDSPYFFWTGWKTPIANPFPFLTITYPANNAEIASSFNITGSFTQPSPATYDWIKAIATPVNILSEYPDPFYFPLSKASSTTAGNFTVWISGFSAGYYDFYMYFENASTGAIYPYPISNWIAHNIHIVNDLPFSLPPYAEQPPYTAPSVFETLNPITYYTANSGYATSTAFYTTFTDILAPILLTLGQNLIAYSSNFTPSNASSTGNQIGQSVVLIRSYLSNINSFFNNFPVSQFLVLYLIVLLLVVVLRLVKGLIHLFKPV